MFALNIIFDILKNLIIFHKECLIEITCHHNINITKKIILIMFYGP